MVQVMECCLFGHKSLLEPRRTYCQLDPQKQTSVDFELKCMISILENAFQHVIGKMLHLFCLNLIMLTNKQLEMHECVLSTVDTDALVL